MSFYSEASLAYVASAGAGKDGKAYSMKPVDGTGDFTFSRGSNLAATRVGPTGLIEKGRENLLLQSNNFTTTWTKINSSVTSGQGGYDGFSDAWLLTKSGTNGSVRQTLSTSGVSTFSVYAKANNSNYIVIQFQGTFAYFDLTTGLAQNETSGIISATSTDEGNGWYRCSIVFNISASSTAYIYPAENGSVSGTSGSVYIQDAQIEIGLAATEVISTGATTGKAGLLEDEPRFDYSGGATCPSLLLEPSRTQYIPYTEYLEGLAGDAGLNFNYNNATSPEGLTNAAQVVSNNTSQSYVGYFNGTTTAGDNTFSVFAKYDNCQYICIRILSFTGGDDGYYWFDIQNGTKGSKSGSTITYDVEDYGNGWYRCYLVHNVDAGDLSGAARIYLSDSDSSLSSALNQAAHLYGFQWEAGSYLTSYIPNHSGGTITRGAEDITSDTSSLGITDEFTLFIDADAVSVEGTVLNAMDDLRWYVQLNNRYRFYKTSDRIYISNNITIDDRTKIALKITASECKTFVDGVLDSTISLTTPFASFDSIYRNTQTKFKDNLNQILLFPTALSDADCITLTT